MKTKQFIGSLKMNVLPCRRSSDGLLGLSDEGDVTLPLAAEAAPVQPRARPEHLSLYTVLQAHFGTPVDAAAGILDA